MGIKLRAGGVIVDKTKEFEALGHKFGTKEGPVFVNNFFVSSFHCCLFHQLLATYFILFTNGLVYKLLQICVVFVVTLGLDMSEDQLLVELSFTNIWPQVTPLIVGHTFIARRFNQVHLVGVNRELEHHGYVIEIREGDSPDQFLSTHTSSK